MKQCFILMIALFCGTSSVFAGQKPSMIVEYKRVDDIKLNLHIFNPPNHKLTDKRPVIIFFLEVAGSPAVPISSIDKVSIWQQEVWWLFAQITGHRVSTKQLRWSV